MEKKLRIGVGGSAADPPHLGHQELIRKLLNCGLFDIVIWIVSGGRKDKRIKACADDRAAMTNLLLVRNWFLRPVRLMVSFEDIYTNNTPSINWLEKLSAEYPGANITWFTGSDSVIKQGRFGNLCEIEARWFRGEEMMREWPFLIIPRQGYPIPEDLPSNFSVLPAGLPNISSSYIRHLVREGKPFDYLTGAMVAHYIKSRKLYGFNG